MTAALEILQGDVRERLANIPDEWTPDMTQSYTTFLKSKAQAGTDHGFSPLWRQDSLFDFQQALVEWSLKKGRAAIFADCGLGKTPIQLVWAENVVRKTNGRVLILTPLAVGAQTIREGEKFGVECKRSHEGELPSKIVITNYERLHYFNTSDFQGVVCDESSILKNFDGATKAAVTEFMRTVPYRLLCTATAAPNDFIELGTSSEALGELGYMDMLSKFFKNSQNSNHPIKNGRFATGEKWRFRGHAEIIFWRWICSWARAMRNPSDLGFDDGAFVLPPLTINQHTITARTIRDGYMFNLPAVGLKEQREERRRTINERCEKVAELVSDTGKPAVCWCHLNDEGDLLEHLIPDAVQVAGKDSDERKEKCLLDFQAGHIRVLVTKAKIAGFGLNWQHCAHQTCFPSHSFEQWYQSTRRSWRFGQKNPVVVDVVTSEGEIDVLKNMTRKQHQADIMFERLVALMDQGITIAQKDNLTQKEQIPSWL